MQTTITDRNGRSTVQGYDYDLAVSWTRNELGLTERVTYSQVDGQNKYNEVESSTDIYGNTTTYERDSRGNVIRITYPDGSVEQFGFDSLNNMIIHTDRNNDTTWYVYDGYYLQKEIQPLDGVSAYSEAADQDNYAIMEYIYDPNAVKKGAVQKIYNQLNDAYNYTAYEYNEIGEIACETRYIDGTAYNTQYFYDNVHRLTKQIDPDGTITEYVYNLAGQIVRTTVTNGSVVSVNRTVYDDLGRKVQEIGPVQYRSEYDYIAPETVTGGSYSDTNQYDVLGRRILAVNANGTSEKTEYNAAGLITRLTNYSGPNAISKYEYTYYYDGNQRTKIDESGKTSYVYDDLGRLTEAQLADGTLQNYTFDSNGNRKTMTVTKDGALSITEYAYDLNDRLITETKDGVKTSYSYDNNGNMLGKSDGTSVVTQTFDLLNRMTSFSDGETTATYTYNPDNMRRSKTVNGVKTEHIWVGSDIALDITGNSVVSYVQVIKSNYGWYVYNAHGDVVQLCDNNGVVTKSYDYDPYGNQLTEADALDKNPYRYSGEYYDAESGYIYLRARYYDSATGRFISEDPAFDGFNWYAYCGGNPLNRWDPSGQAWYDWVPRIASVTVGTIMCATGFGTPIGIGLITGGASDLLSSTLGAAGFDPKFVSMATAGSDVLIGSILLLTPFAPVGAGMVGSGYGALAGGAISENLGGSYEFGANIGSIVGGVVGSAVYSKISAFKVPTKVCASKPGKLSGSLDDLSPDERKMVNDLLNQGKNVEIIPRSNLQGVKTPDFRVNGVLTELKTLNGTSLNTPVSKIQKAFNQGASTVIVDGRATDITIEQANGVLSRINGIYKENIPGSIEIWTNAGIVYGGRRYG